VTLLSGLRGWIPLLLLPTSVLAARSRLAPWIFMWTLAAAIYAGCKWLTWRRSTSEDVPVWKHAGYLFAWPGLDADRFLCGRGGDVPDAREWGYALLTTALGIVLFFVFARWMPGAELAAWVGMVGFALAFHFGLLHLLSCAWRMGGVDAHRLMNNPLRSASLGDFWGRRWNTAFRDLTHQFLFRPLAPRFGARGAILAAFVFSGVVHELVISVPARGGYGGPTMFFCAQGLGLLFERGVLAQRLGLARGWRGWLFAMALLVSTAPVLFHPPFLRFVIVPFMRATGAL
jgi:Membrane bound O-acyl transferase family